MRNNFSCFQEKTRRSQQRADKKGEKQIADPEEEYSRAPHTFVINRGAVGKNVSRLVRDMRRVMEPFTASQLKVGVRLRGATFPTILGFPTFK